MFKGLIRDNSIKMQLFIKYFPQHLRPQECRVQLDKSVEIPFRNQIPGD